MKRHVFIEVFANTNMKIDYLVGFSQFANAKFSSADEVNVNEIAGQYAILYEEATLISLDHHKFVKIIDDLFTSTFPDDTFVISMVYHYLMDPEKVKENDDYINIQNQANEDTVNYLRILEFDFSRSSMQYIPLQDFNIAKMSNDTVVRCNEEDQEEYDDESVMDSSEVMDLYKMMIDSYDDDDSDHKNKKHKNHSKKSYTSSRVLKSAKNGKKMYKRHGVIVIDNKKAAKIDEKIIKDFLKDFIPGGGWKKDFREDVLKRWLTMFMISKKNLKKLEKKHRKSIKSGKHIIDADRAIALTKRLFSTTNDIWNDPNK